MLFVGRTSVIEEPVKRRAVRSPWIWIAVSLVAFYLCLWAPICMFIQRRTGQTEAWTFWMGKLLANARLRRRFPRLCAPEDEDTPSRRFRFRRQMRSEADTETHFSLETVPRTQSKSHRRLPSSDPQNQGDGELQTARRVLHRPARPSDQPQWDLTPARSPSIHDMRPPPSQVEWIVYRPFTEQPSIEQVLIGSGQLGTTSAALQALGVPAQPDLGEQGSSGSAGAVMATLRPLPHAGQDALVGGRDTQASWYTAAERYPTTDMDWPVLDSRRLSGQSESDDDADDRRLAKE